VKADSPFARDRRLDYAAAVMVLQEPPMEHQHPADALLTSRDRALAAFTEAGSQIEQRPADGGWNAWEIAYHLFDIERWYIAKLCEASTSDRPAALQRFLAVWSRLRDEAAAIAADIPAERMDVPGLLSGVPDWTPRLLIDAMAAHDHEHAAQVRDAASPARDPTSDS
jgi:hypothetical protein